MQAVSHTRAGGAREGATTCQAAHLRFLLGRVPRRGRCASEGDETRRRRGILGRRCNLKKVPIRATSLTVKRPCPRPQIRADHVAAAIVVGREQAGGCAHKPESEARRLKQQHSMSRDGNRSNQGEGPQDKIVDTIQSHELCPGLRMQGARTRGWGRRAEGGADSAQRRGVQHGVIQHRGGAQARQHRERVPRHQRRMLPQGPRVLQRCLQWWNLPRALSVEAGSHDTRAVGDGEDALVRTSVNHQQGAEEVHCYAPAQRLRLPRTPRPSPQPRSWLRRLFCRGWPQPPGLDAGCWAAPSEGLAEAG